MGVFIVAQKTVVEYTALRTGKNFAIKRSRSHCVPPQAWKAKSLHVDTTPSLDSKKVRLLSMLI